MIVVDVTVSGLVFGDRYRDTMTDFEGVAEAVWMKHDGTVQVSLAYHDGTVPKTVWLDTSRLVPVTRSAPGISRVFHDGDMGGICFKAVDDVDRVCRRELRPIDRDGGRVWTCDRHGDAFVQLPADSER